MQPADQMWASDPTSPPSPPFNWLAPVVSDADVSYTLGEFAQILSHRIRSLLLGIEGYTDLLADTLGTPEQRELALRILEGSARIESVLSDLQHYCQPVNLVKLPIRSHAVIQRLIDTLDDHELQRVVLDIDREDQSLIADPLLLRQALLLLIHNAFDASPGDDPVTLRTIVDRKTGVVNFEVWNAGTIKVDNPEEKVFEPFFTTKAQNLGLGLPIARKIAEVHEGHLVLVSNTRTDGTGFRLVVPAASRKDRDPVALPPSRKRPTAVGTSGEASLPKFDH